MLCHIMSGTRQKTMSFKTMRAASCLLLLALAVGALAAVDNAVDRAALVDLYQSTNGPQWLNNSGWLQPGTSMCAWFGVIGCDCVTNASECRVTQLQSGGPVAGAPNNLCGPIPNSIGNLRSLSLLDLGSNSLNGTIPASLGNLVNMTSLRLSVNLLTGTIPPSLGNMRSLVILHLDYNDLTGPIPDTFGNCLAIQIFTMYVNRLSSTIPASLGRLVNMTTFGVDVNQMNGTIPDSFANLTNLQSIYLYGNQFSGTLPSFIGTYSNLVRFQSQDNLFSGTIPDSFQNLARLTVFNMSNNRMTGSLPNWINNWTSVQHIRMAFNSLSSSIPESIGLLPNLLTLDLSANQLSGTIPYSLRQLTRLSSLDLSSNRLVSGPSGSFDLLTSTFSPPMVNVSSNLLGPVLQSYQSPAAGTSILAFLDVEFNDFVCPYPTDYPTSVVLLRSPCYQPWTRYGIYTGIAVAVLAFIVGCVYALRRFISNNLTPHGREIAFTIMYFISWAVETASLTLDVISLVSIVGYLLESVDNCAPLNQYSIFSKYMSWFPYPVDPGQSNPSLSFTSWYQFFVNKYGATSGASMLMSEFSNIVCRQLINECDYDPIGNSCFRAHPELASNGGSAHRPFFIFVMVVIAVRGCLELVRLMVIFKSAYDRSVWFERAGADFVRSSVLSPLMWPFMGRAFVDQVVLHEAKFAEIMRRLLNISLLSTVPQLFVNLYYLLAVSQSGLQLATLLSILTSCITFALLLSRGFLLYVKEHHGDWHSRLRDDQAPPTPTSGAPKIVNRQMSIMNTLDEVEFSNRAVSEMI